MAIYGTPGCVFWCKTVSYGFCFWFCFFFSTGFLFPGHCFGWQGRKLMMRVCACGDGMANAVLLYYFLPFLYSEQQWATIRVLVCPRAIHLVFRDIHDGRPCWWCLGKNTYSLRWTRVTKAKIIIIIIKKKWLKWIFLPKIISNLKKLMLLQQVNVCVVFVLVAESMWNNVKRKLKKTEENGIKEVQKIMKNVIQAAAWRREVREV